MGAPAKLDAAGTQKLKTIEEAHVLLQRIHGMVENYGLALKQNKPASMYHQQIKRTLPLLVGMLKGQFGLIADVAATVNLSSSRGGSDTVRLRTMREGVGALRQQLDIAVVRIKDNHAVKEVKPDAPGGTS